MTKGLYARGRGAGYARNRSAKGDGQPALLSFIGNLIVSPPRVHIFLFAVAFRSGKRTQTDLDQLDTETGCPNAAGDFHGSGREDAGCSSRRRSLLNCACLMLPLSWFLTLEVVRL